MAVKPLLVCGVAGGSASGKSTVVKKIISAFPPTTVALLDQDSYYADLSELTFEQRKVFNFDHPDAFDTELLLSHIEKLLNGEPIEKPIYSFEQYTRTNQTTKIEPAPVILIEGILVLWFKELREKMHIRIFVDTPDDIRLIRRIERDVQHRGRSVQDVIDQYRRAVRPMHISFCEPTKQFADIIIPEGGFNEVAINLIIESIKGKLIKAGKED